MAAGNEQPYDFFLSRRGSVSAVSREVADVLSDKGYKVFVQDYDIPLDANLIEKMHEGIKNSRGLIILYTGDYERSPYTRKEFTSFEAHRLRDPERHIVILRCEDIQPQGLLADTVYQDLFDSNTPEERKCRIIAGVEGRSQASPPPALPFVGVPPRIASFTGRADKFDHLDASLANNKPAAVTQSVGRASGESARHLSRSSTHIDTESFTPACGGVRLRRGAGYPRSVAALALSAPFSPPVCSTCP